MNAIKQIFALAVFFILSPALAFSGLEPSDEEEIDWRTYKRPGYLKDAPLGMVIKQASPERRKALSNNPELRVLYKILTSGYEDLSPTPLPDPVLRYFNLVKVDLEALIAKTGRDFIDTEPSSSCLCFSSVFAEHKIDEMLGDFPPLVVGLLDLPRVSLVAVQDEQKGLISGALQWAATKDVPGAKELWQRNNRAFQALSYIFDVKLPEIEEGGCQAIAKIEEAYFERLREGAAADFLLLTKGQFLQKNGQKLISSCFLEMAEARKIDRIKKTIQEEMPDQEPELTAVLLQNADAYATRIEEKISDLFPEKYESYWQDQMGQQCAPFLAAYEEEAQAQKNFFIEAYLNYEGFSRIYEALMGPFPGDPEFESKIKGHFLLKFQTEVTPYLAAKWQETLSEVGELLGHEKKVYLENILEAGKSESDRSSQAALLDVVRIRIDAANRKFRYPKIAEKFLKDMTNVTLFPVSKALYDDFRQLLESALGSEKLKQIPSTHVEKLKIALKNLVYTYPYKDEDLGKELLNNITEELFRRYKMCREFEEIYTPLEAKALKAMLVRINIKTLMSREGGKEVFLKLGSKSPFMKILRDFNFHMLREESIIV